MAASISSPLTKLVLTEFAAVFLWVVCSFALFIVTSSPIVYSISPTLAEFPPMQIFFTGFVGLMALWEILGLWFDSLINPAFTLAMFVARELTLSKSLLLAVPQFLGHIIAIPLVRFPMQYFFPLAKDPLFAPPQPREGVPFAAAVSIEASITAVCCLVTLSMKHLLPQSAKMKKWVLTTSTLLFMMILGLGWTGSCMNPAMSLALAVVHQKWSGQAVYWVGPIVGAVVAGLLHNAIFLRTQTRLSSSVRKRIARSTKRTIKVE